MKEKEKYIYLRDITTPIRFSVHPKNTGEVIIRYVDNYKDEVFVDFFHYLDTLSNYYRNRIDLTEDNKEKISICNKFIDVVQKYKVDLRHQLAKVKPKELYSEIEIHVELFEYFKSRILEDSSFQSQKQEVHNQDSLTLKQKVLILNYLEILDSLLEKVNLKQRATIISELVGQNIDNTTKAIRNVNINKKKGRDAVMTPENLNYIHTFFTQNKLIDLANKVKKDLDKKN